MIIVDFLTKIFGKDGSNSKDVAKKRLQLVLVHDRASISPEILNKLKEDMIRLISHYLEIDEVALQVTLENEKDTVALVANIPILGLKRAAN
jgi:cell division topological specificity factor